MRRSWSAESLRLCAATMELVDLQWLVWRPVNITSASTRSWDGQRPMLAMMALVLADTGAVDDEFVYVQP